MLKCGWIPKFLLLLEALVAHHLYSQSPVLSTATINQKNIDEVGRLTAWL